MRLVQNPILSAVMALLFLLAVSAPSPDAIADLVPQSAEAKEMGAQLIAPSPALLPEDVVAIQLLGLALTKGSSSSIEMRQVWAFAHPSNKAITGPLERFVTLFDLPAYKPLLGHKSHQILRIAEQDSTVQLQVQITAENGKSYLYLWVLGRAAGDDNAGDDNDWAETGSWMTLSVSAPADGGTRS